MVDSLSTLPAAPDPERHPWALTLTVAHYPTGASKRNPIEHRLFSEISKTWPSEPLDSYQKILKFILFNRTETGLSVTFQTKSSGLSNRYGAHTTGSNPFGLKPPRRSAEVELHDLTRSVKLFLRQPLVAEPAVKPTPGGCPAKQLGSG
jgi:hypothetical protein